MDFDNAYNRIKATPASGPPCSNTILAFPKGYHGRYQAWGRYPLDSMRFGDTEVTSVAQLPELQFQPATPLLFFGDAAKQDCESRRVWSSTDRKCHCSNACPTPAEALADAAIIRTAAKAQASDDLGAWDQWANTSFAYTYVLPSSVSLGSVACVTATDMSAYLEDRWGYDTLVYELDVDVQASPLVIKIEGLAHMNVGLMARQQRVATVTQMYDPNLMLARVIYDHMLVRFAECTAEACHTEAQALECGTGKLAQPCATGIGKTLVDTAASFLYAKHNFDALTTDSLGDLELAFTPKTRRVIQDWHAALNMSTPGFAIWLNKMGECGAALTTVNGILAPPTWKTHSLLAGASLAQLDINRIVDKYNRHRVASYVSRNLRGFGMSYDVNADVMYESVKLHDTRVRRDVSHGTPLDILNITVPFAAFGTPGLDAVGACLLLPCKAIP